MAQRKLSYGPYGMFLRDNFPIHAYKDKIKKTNLVSKLEQVYADSFILSFSLYYTTEDEKSDVFTDMFIHVTHRILSKRAMKGIKDLDYIEDTIIPVTFSDASDPPIVQTILRKIFACKNHPHIEQIRVYMANYQLQTKCELPSHY
jgi:hypothetical protein